MADVPAGDPRSEMYQKAFLEGLVLDSYIATGNESQQSRWREAQARVHISSSQETLISNFRRQMNILVLSGIWCGDCMRQGPMLAAIAALNPVLQVRFIDNHAIPELRDSCRIQGGTRVPLALFLSEDYYEVARYGDRTLASYRRKAERELGPACDAGLVPPTEQELAEELCEWLDQFERSQLILRLSPMLRSRHND
ncbi:MAG: thioredoxin family protein [Bdellovibrionales bacterium]|nr:thioredoxin family protein [Bdellovibrionales bacterium]